MGHLILEHGQDKGEKVHIFSLSLCIYIHTHMKVRAYDFKSKKQKRREKNPKGLLKKLHTDWSYDRCGWLCFRDPINPLQLHEVLLNLGVGDSIFPCALPFS